MTAVDILDDLLSCLELESEEGMLCESVSPEVLEAMSACGSLSAKRPPVSADGACAPAAADPERKPGVESVLAQVARDVALCKRCPLHASRGRTVPGQGDPNPEIVFVGEGPGADEDREGLAFVGKAGALLTKMIVAMGYGREAVFICNVVKCRPPNNRVPEPSEMAACLPYLRRQLLALSPKVIITLGATALKGLVDLPKGMGITKVRGTWMRFEGIDLMPTFHPAYLLRNANMKKYVWQDLQTVLRHLGKPIPKR